MVKDIKGSVDIEDMGEPTWLLGIKIARNCDLVIIHISQPSFIDMIAKWFEISPGCNLHAPMDLNIKLWALFQDEITPDLLYVTLIGSINYCRVSTCPDITHTMNKCAQYTSKLNISHWEAAKRIVRYLIQTSEYGISYQRKWKGINGYAHSLAGYTDAVFAGNKDDCKSTSGWLFTYSTTLHPYHAHPKTRNSWVIHPWNLNL